MTATATTTSSASNALTIYISDPSAVRANQALQDVVDAEELGYQQNKGTVRANGLRLEVLTGAEVSDNARDAIGDNSAIAYLGEVQHGQSVQTVGITNAQDLLEFSPTDTVVPDKANYEDDATYGRTFASVAGNLGTTTAALTRANPQFAKTFQQDFRHAPSAQAIDGYVAVQVLLRVLVGAKDDADNRQNIVNGVQHTLSANRGDATVSDFTIKF